MFKFIRSFLNRLGNFILHKTIFHSKLNSGKVDMYGLKEEPKEGFDGMVVVYDARHRRQDVYGYRFDNRYMMQTTPHVRCLAIWQEILMIDQIRPLAILENDKAYTPYGSYDPIPSMFKNVIAETLNAPVVELDPIGELATAGGGLTAF